MMTEERREKIKKMLFESGRVLVREVSRDLNISEVTIRKDLEALEQRGVLSRVHGGAIITESLVSDKALTEKAHLYADEKERIARRAASMIKKGDVVVLDSGSTTTQIARQIKMLSDVTVITNAVNIATELASSQLSVILTGGNLREKSFSLVGPLAEDSLRHFTANKFFLAVDGIHPEFGLTTPNLQEVRVNQLMMKMSMEIILVADHSKFGRRSMGVISKVGAVDKVITDDKAAGVLPLLNLNGGGQK